MKKALLLLNLGSPDSPNIPDVKKYLHEFLMDPYVLDIPWLNRWLLVNLIILNTRPKNSAHAYQTIWTNEGSPLISISKAFHKAIAEKLPIPTMLAMRYGNPSIKDTLAQLLAENPDLEELIVLPLYPHFAMSSTLTVQEKVKTELKKLGKTTHIKLKFIPPFYNHPDYIQNLSDSIKPYIQTNFEHLLFSYHGLPERHLKKCDPTKNHCLTQKNCCDTPSIAHQTCYRHQVRETTKLVCEKLHLPQEKITLAYQSRLGRTPWLRPYTDEVLEDLAKQGIQHLHVVCPAFVADCLETLEEIQVRATEIFQNAGGKTLTYIPCLNTNPEWIQTVVSFSQDAIDTK